MYMVEDETRGFDFEVGLAGVKRLTRWGIDHFKPYTHADQSATGVNSETREPLGRLVGQQKGGDKGEELTGCGAGFDHTVTTIGDGHRNRAAAKRFHQWTRAIGHACHLVGLVLDRSNIAVETLAHDVFESKGLDDADALQSIQQCLDN